MTPPSIERPTDPLREALRVALRRPRLTLIVMGIISVVSLVATRLANTDTAGRVMGLVLAGLFACVALLSAREIARQKRMVQLVVEQPEQLVWANYVRLRGPRSQGLGSLDLYDAAGHQVRFALPAAHGAETFELLREHCPTALATHHEGGYQQLYEMWRASPADFAARARQAATPAPPSRPT